MTALSTKNDKLIAAYEDARIRNFHRDEFYKALESAIGSRYIIDRQDAAGVGRFIVPRAEVQGWLANHFHLQIVSPQFSGLVNRTMENLGAMLCRLTKVIVYRGVRRADHCIARAIEDSKQIRRQNSTVGKQTVEQIQKRALPGSIAYYKKLLAEEGMPEELAAAGIVDPDKAAMGQHRIDRATEAFWRLERDRLIVLLYMQGCSIREIAKRTVYDKWIVWKRLCHFGLTTTDNDPRSWKPDPLLPARPEPDWPKAFEDREPLTHFASSRNWNDREKALERAENSNDVLSLRKMVNNPKYVKKGYGSRKRVFKMGGNE